MHCIVVFVLIENAHYVQMQQQNWAGIGEKIKLAVSYFLIFIFFKLGRLADYFRFVSA